MPVRIMGGVSRVEMADVQLAVPSLCPHVFQKAPPLLLCSLTAPMLDLKPESSTPPTEWIELAVEPRRG